MIQMKRFCGFRMVSIIIIVSTALAGCARTTIQSKKNEAYKEKLVKTAIISSVQQHVKDDLGSGFAQAFEEKLSAGLTARGVKVLVIAIDELGLDASVYDKKLAEFAPSTVLVVRPVGSLREGYGQVRAVRFDVSVGPRSKSAARVWRASVELRVGDFTNVEMKAKTLAEDIIAKLIEDELL